MRYLHQRFEEYLSEPNEHGCRIWQGIVKAGRGMFVLESTPKLKWISAAKWAYQFYKGPVPLGFHAMPRCGEPLCMEHLTLKTNSQLVKMAIKKGFRPNPALYLKAPHFKGEENPNCRYSNEKASEILKEREKGTKIQVIALRHKMPVSTVWWICTGRFVEPIKEKIPTKK